MGLVVEVGEGVGEGGDSALNKKGVPTSWHHDPGGGGTCMVG